MSAVDLTVQTVNPELLDRTVQQLGPAVVIEDSYDAVAKTAVVRVFGNPGFIKFAIDNQGYGKVVSEESVS